MKALEFRIRAEFGMFRRHDSHPENSLTFGWMPKSAVLGVCGAILGLRGYSEGSPKPEFLDRLSSFKVAVAPLENSFDLKFRRTPFKRTTVKFNNYHGFGNKAGNMICSEQLLINPAFLVTIVSEDNRDFKELENKLRTNSAVFRPYMGKNEFVAEIEFFGLYDAVKNQDKIIECKSIYPISTNYQPNIRDTTSGNYTFAIMDEYPYSWDEKYRNICKIFAFRDGRMNCKEADEQIGTFYTIKNNENKIVFAF